MLLDLIRKNRSYRRFKQDSKITAEQLAEWINLARLSASARNAQALKYWLVYTDEECRNVFPSLAWAGYLKDWSGPEEGERPSAYIVMLHDTTLASTYFCDDGIAAQSIMLGAVEAGFGGCMIAAVNKTKLRNVLEIPDQYEILMVLALGEPVEEVVIDEMQGDDFKYWRDAEGVHHVPKRKLEDLIVKKKKGEEI